MTDSSPPLPSGPARLAFLDLGERLRQRGQLEAAESVARAGLAHYPALSEAHDLVARIAADSGDDAGAALAWEATLALAPGHLGALKGLAYLAFRRQDLEAAQDRLEAAAAEAPHDPAILAALDRVRALRPAAPPETAAVLGRADAGMLLFDGEGLRITGALEVGSEAAADLSAAEAAGLGREAARTARLLDLGAWAEISVEGPSGRLCLVPVEAGTMLLVRRPHTTPIGRLRALAARGVVSARAWIAGGGT